MATTHTGSPAAGGNDGAQGNGSIVGKMRERATAQLAAQKDRAVDGIGSVTQAVRESTHQLRNQQHDTLAGYVERAADEIDRLSQQLRNKNVGELFEDAQRLARRQPALFIGSAFALGVLGARFLKSSSERAHRNGEYDREGHAEYASAGPYPGYGSTGTEGTQRSRTAAYSTPAGGATMSAATPGTSASTAEGSPSSGNTGTSPSAATGTSSSGTTGTSRARKSSASER